MLQKYLCLALLAGAGCVTGQNTPPGTVAEDKPGERTITGVLMDASCPAIASTTRSRSRDASLPPSSGVTINDGRAPHHGSSTETGKRSDTDSTGMTNSVHAPDNTSQSGTAPGTEPGMIKVREKYKDCRVKADTTEFAMHSDGKLYFINDEGNEMIREQMKNEAFRAAMTEKTGAPKWLSVTVIGTPGPGNELDITSVRK